MNERSPLEDRSFVGRVAAWLREPWSTSDFESREQAEFARERMTGEAQSGLRTLASLFLIPLVVAAAAARPLGLDAEFGYAFLALAGLAVHVHFSSRAIGEIRAIYLLGMVLLVVSSTAFVLIAHRTGSLDAALFASVGFLFMVIPAMPWGLREGLLTSAIIYGLFTASTWSVAERFDDRSLWGLQVYMLTAAFVSTTLVARTALIRKHDLKTRFRLDRARTKLETLSLQDALTGLWNRRYLEAEFTAWSSPERRKDRVAWIALVDLDDFKSVNDSHGHLYGDRVLGWAARALEEAVRDGGFVARVGGDELACLIDAEDGPAAVQRAVEAFSKAYRVAGEVDRTAPTFSAGLARLPMDRECGLDEVYKAADNALYEAKRGRSREARECSIVAVELGASTRESV